MMSDNERALPYFDSLAPSTMVCVVEVFGYVDIKQAFPLLRMYRFELDKVDPIDEDCTITPIKKKAKSSIKKTNRSKKWKCPWPGEGGHIVSGGWGRVRRGIVRPNRVGEKKDYFPGCAMLDVSTSTKNVNLKVMNRSMQMCGALSREMAHEAASTVIQEVYNVQSMLDHIQANKEIAIDTANWIIDITKGDLIDEAYTVNVPMLVEEVPPNVDIEMGQALLNMALDYSSHSMLCKMYEWVLQPKTVIEPDTCVGNIRTCMYLYSTNLGYSINRSSLHRSFCYWCITRNIFWVPDGFTCMFEATTDDTVCIYYYYKKVSEEIKSRIKLRDTSDNSIRVSIKVAASGKLNFSGPCPELVTPVYELFNEFCLELSSSFVSINHKNKLID